MENLEPSWRKTNPKTTTPRGVAYAQGPVGAVPFQYRVGMSLSQFLSQSLRGNARLDRLWELVLENYGDETRHLEFLRQSQLDHQLPFAAQKYRWLLDVNPMDDVAVKMRIKLLHLTELTYLPTKGGFRGPRWYGWDVTSVLLFFGSGMVTAGVLEPRLGPLSGIGIMLITLTVIQRVVGFASPKPF